MSSPTVEFESPSSFILDGDGVSEWRNSLGVLIPGAEFTKLFKKKLWDGKKYPGRRDRSQQLHLYRGLLTKAVEDLHATITKPPEVPPLGFLNIEGLGLRDYQEESLRLIYGKRWGRIALATNAGKGAIIALAAKGFATSGWTTLILCDEIAVMDALKEEIEKWTGRTPVLLQAGVVDIPRKGSIVLGMVPTLHRRLQKEEWQDWFLTVDALLLDEADKAGADTWQHLLATCANSHVRIGFSGTFSEGMDVRELILLESIGPVLTRVKNEELIRRGISAKPIIHLHPLQHTLKLPEWKTWEEMSGPQKRMYIYENCVVRNEWRHQLILRLLDPNYSNAIIINYIEHGEELSRVIPNSVFIYGRVKADTRRGVLEEFRKGTFQNLITTQILDRGTNQLGHAFGVVFASGQGSDTQTLQRIGRGLRRTNGKEFLFLKDIIDRVKIYSFHGREIKTPFIYLENSGKARVELYNSEGFELSIMSES